MIKKACKTSVSVIIPVYNEERNIRRLLDSLVSIGGLEVIVVDGESTDTTLSIVRQFQEVRYTTVSRGRAAQLNAGAGLARNEILCFVHADATLPQGFCTQICTALAKPGVIAGAFALQFDYPGFCLRFYAKMSRINHQLFTFGDQGLFVRRSFFNRIGGFASLPIMEDYEIQKRLRPLGKFVKLPGPIITSARRFRKYGVVWQQIRNLFLLLCYELGISPAWIAKFYRY